MNELAIMVTTALISGLLAAIVTILWVQFKEIIARALQNAGNLAFAGFPKCGID